MNKGELVAAVSSKTELNKAQAGAALEAVMQSILEGVREDDKVTLPGFGTFKKKHRKERTGRNPATRQPMLIPESTTMSFTPSSTVKDLMK